MKTREVSVIGRTVYGNGEIELVRTSVGIDQMHVLFDSAEWVAFGAVSVTFKNSADTENPITTSITPTAIDSPDWSAEATCLIPWEVIQNVGDIAVTFQAINSSSKHLITARAESVLSVIEAGDVNEGTVPSTAPTLSEWEQAYADAASATGLALSAADHIESILDSTSGETLVELLESMGYALRYKGSVNEYGDLPTYTAETGFVYTVKAPYQDYPKNTDFFYTGTDWEAIGASVAVDELTKEEIDRAIEGVPDFAVDGFGLPDDMVRLEYIRSYTDAGYLYASYIDTGIPCNTQDLAVEVDFKHYTGSSAADGFLFGDFCERNRASFGVWHTRLEEGQSSPSVNFNIAYINGRNESVINNVMSLYDRHQLKLTSAGVCYIDDEMYLNPAYGDVSSRNLCLFGTNEGLISVADFHKYGFSGYVYRAKIWSGDILLRDFIPAADSQGVAGLYDRVSGHFFTNENEDVEFTKGPEISTLAYLGQTGVSYLWELLSDSITEEIGDIATATPSTNGLMSASDKSKLDGIEAQANKVVAGSGLVLTDGTMSLGNIVTDSCDGPIYSVDAEGWSEQVSTVGKNLLNPSLFEDNKYQNARVSNWVISDNNNHWVVGMQSVSELTTYCISGATPPYNLVVCYDSSRTAIEQVIVSNNVFTTLANTAYICFSIAKSVMAFGGTIQLELGSTATEYEPYSGAKPSPSPEFPQTIEVCRGRNLLDKTAITSGYWDVETGDAGSSIDWQKSPKIPVVGGESYVFSGYVKMTGNYVSYKEDGTFLKWLKPADGDISVNASGLYTVITMPSNAAYLAFYCSTIASYIDIDKLQVELGSTPTPYVPYGCVGLEVQGRNLADKSKFVSAYVKSSDGQLISNTDYVATHYIPVKQGEKYRIITDMSGTEKWWYSENFSPLSTIGSGSNIVATAPQDGYMRVTATASYANSLMVSHGEEAYPYEPYYHETRAIPLPLKSDNERWAGGLPDGAADELAIDSAGRWEWTNETNEVVFDGSESTWAISSNSKRVYIAQSDMQYFASGVSPLLASHFIAKTSDATYAGTQGVSINGYSSAIEFCDGSGSMTVNDWKTWLSTHNVTVLYPLATPTTEHGYVDLPMDIPEGSTVTIPELENTNVRCFVHGAAELAIHAANWGHRNAEMESRLAAVESALAEIATA